jgi:hypothetical protein
LHQSDCTAHSRLQVVWGGRVSGFGFPIQESCCTSMSALRTPSRCSARSLSRPCHSAS